MSDKLNINNEMAQLDRKNRGFYDELNDEEKKKFSTYLALRWGTSLAGSAGELQSYYVQSCNQQVNRNFWNLSRHPKLQWLLLTTISPGMGVHKHEWIAFKGKQAKNKRGKLIGEIFPDIKMSDADLLAETISEKELKQYLTDLGWEDKRIKEALK
jgi:hypothetical protein